MRRVIIGSLALVALYGGIACAPLPAEEIGKTPDLSQASWIWTSREDPTVAGPVGHFRRKFDLPARPVEATVVLTADNGYELFVNTRRVAGELSYSAKAWRSVERFRIEDLLSEGANVIAIQGECLGGAAGVVAALYARMPDGSELSFVTDDQWLAMAEPEGNWTEPDHDDTLWKPAAKINRMGAAPWGMLAVPSELTDPDKLVIDPSTPGGSRRPKRDEFTEPGPDFRWPAGVVYVEGKAPLHSTAAQRAKWEIHGSRAFFEYDTPAPAFSGQKLYALTPARAGGTPRLLVDAGEGLVASPSATYDGREILFAMVPEGEKFFKIFRIGADGSGLERLTTGPWHDYEPAELPDGRIVFASTRVGSRDEYHGNTAHSLFCLNADRTQVSPLTYHIVADSEPEVTADGRIALVRHDNFMERAKVETHVHCIRPDGTAGEVLIGPDRGAIGYDRATAAEDSYSWLRNYGFACPAPLPDGRVACISHLGPVIASFDAGKAEKTPMPSDVNLFDISPLPDGRLLCSTIAGTLGILDPDTGRTVELLKTEGRDLHSVAYLGPRPKPPAMVAGVDENAEWGRDRFGYLYCQSIFQTKQTGGDWQRVKAVRIFMGKPFTLRSAHHQYCHIGVEGVELGTAPLAPDGSFYARVPADQALAIQAVDAEGRSVVNELSWIYVRPGERRSCTGCHNHREAAPGLQPALATRGRPVDLLPSGDPHRFRGNNAANGGVLNLQFDRFREAASIDLYRQRPLSPGDDPKELPPARQSEIDRLIETLAAGDSQQRRTAAARLAIFRERTTTPALCEALGDTQTGVRTAAAMALASCGDRGAVGPLLAALGDRAPQVAQAAAVALEHLTGHSEPFNPYGDPSDRDEGAAAWRAWIDSHDWATIERDLAARVESADATAAHLAIEALGHVGDEVGREAVRKYVASNAGDSLVARLAAIRALGQLQDASSVALLAGILEENTVERPVKPAKSHEFGWAAMPDHLAGAAAESLGRIGTPEAEARLIQAYAGLADFWYYTFRTADHNWLMGCHSSIPHFRIAEALDAIGSREAAGLTAGFLKSVPIDTDRGLLYENDAYETLVGRLVQRNGKGREVMETCLSVLGDPEARPVESLVEAVTASPPAVSVGPLCPESRAAQLLSVVCIDPGDAPRVRRAFERYRAGEPSRKQSWTCFFLARTLGKLQDRGSVDTLCSALVDDPAEAERGRPAPPNVFLHDAITPLYRAAAADALGRIGAAEACPALLAVVGDFDNAMEVRQAAAVALGRIGDPATLVRLETLAREYPEAATRRSLWQACDAVRSRAVAALPAGE